MNLEEQVQIILRDFPEERVRKMLQEEIEATPEKIWSAEGYDNAQDWYRDCGNGQKDDNVIYRLITYWEGKYNGGRVLDENKSAEMHDRLLEEYMALA
jgi:hypothetical protein